MSNDYLIWVHLKDKPVPPKKVEPNDGLLGLAFCCGAKLLATVQRSPYCPGKDVCDDCLEAAKRESEVGSGGVYDPNRIDREDKEALDKGWLSKRR